MFLTRRDLLGSLAAGSLLAPLGAGAVRPSGPKNLIVFMAAGGWDTTYCFDPKLGVADVHGPELDSDPTVADDVEAIQTFGEIPVMVNEARRPSVTSFFTQWHHKTAVVNGLWMRAIAHQSCITRLLTGSPSFANPDFATIAGHALGVDLPLGSIDFTGFSARGELGASAGRVGLRNQLKALVDAESVYATPEGSPYSLPLFTPDDLQRDRVRAFLESRAAQFESLWGDGGHNTQHVTDLLESMRRSTLLRERAPDVLAALPMGGVATASSQLEVAVQLLEGDICRAVLVDHQHPWDSHADNDIQHGNYEDYFGALHSLCTSLDARGMLDDTLVVGCSEMARTPQLNSRQGKEHWPHNALIFVGGGVAGGRTFGGTTDSLESRPVDLSTGEVWDGGTTLAYEHLSAGLLKTLGVDHELWFPGVEPYIGPLHG